MPVQIGQPRQADFDDPLGMLSDCHRRIESFLGALLRLARERKGQHLDDAAHASLKNALEYFRHSGPRHTADEEESLFPRMRECQGSAEALRAIEALRSDHVVADRVHAEVDTLGTKWLHDGKLADEDAQRLSELLESLSKLYAHHIDVEDHQVFPAASRILQAGQISSIGEEMARRRGLRRVIGVDPRS